MSALHLVYNIFLHGFNLQHQHPIVILLNFRLRNVHCLLGISPKYMSYFSKEGSFNQEHSH